MAGILDLYGIKEVADVVFWDTKTKRPVLYLDTLKVSTIEETAEQTEARGGKGNPPLIIWDYDKEITITLEDALFSMKSMSVMHNHAADVSTATAVSRAVKFVAEENGAVPSSVGDIIIPSDAKVYNAEGALFSSDPTNASESDVFGPSLSAGERYMAAWIDSNISDVQQIIVSSSDFPGTYRITGDTYARSQDTGVDEFFQFEIPLAKVNPEQTITMQAEGDPSTFSMTVRVMRPADGKMMMLTKYAQNKPIQYSINRGASEQASYTIAKDATQQLAPVVLPQGASITWSSSDDTKASVSSAGLVTGVAATTEPVTITATMVEDSSKSVSYSFTVTGE